MTEFVRRALGSLPRITHPARDAAPVDSLRTVQVTVRAPQGTLDRSASGLAHVLSTRLERWCADLGIQAEPTIALVEDNDRPELTVSIDGRPVMLAAVEDIAGHALPDHVLHACARRLPLLLGPADDHPVEDYLVSIGCAVRDADPTAPADMDPAAAAVRAERLIENSAPLEIVADVSPENIRRVDARGLQAVRRLRSEEFRRFGVRYPDIRVRLDPALADRVIPRFNDVVLPPVRVAPEASWSEVVTALAPALIARRHWFLTPGDVARQLSEDLEPGYPELIAATMRAFSVEEITACLRELLRSGRRIRNLPRILWLMLEQGDTHGGADMLRLSEAPLTPRSAHRAGTGRDPVVLATRVRKIAAEESWRLGNFQPPTGARRLPAALETRLASSTGDDRAAAEWSVVRAVAGDPSTQRIVTRTIEAIGPVRAAVQALPRRIRVLASQELPPDFDLTTVPTLTRGADRRAHLTARRPSLRRR